MSAKKDLLAESQLVDLTDDELKETLGALWERLKALKEAEANDPDAEQMRAQLKAYLDDNYKSERKEVEKRLKAARVIAKARGLKWRMPQPK